MLRELSVQNLALIEDARIDLKAGYCAWTGETGAGKSLLLTALGLVLGGKASSDLVRTGKDEARAAAIFEISIPTLKISLEAILGGPIDDDEIILTRRISAQGRSTCHVNGFPVPLATLKLLGERLVDIHGQQETRALLDPHRQSDLLDAFGEIEPLRATYESHRATHRNLLDLRTQLLADAANLERERALLTFERDELVSAEPQVGEFDDLAREAHRLANADAVRSAALDGYSSLYESDRSAQGLLEAVARKLAPLCDAVPEFADAGADLLRLADEIREVAYSLRQFAKDCDDDPHRLDEVETRLALYRRLASRFRCDADKLATHLEEIELKLARIDGLDAGLKALDGPIAKAWAEVVCSGLDLHAARDRVGMKFARAVRLQMKGLGLDQSRLTLEIESDPFPDDPFTSAGPENGGDRVEFFFAANPGEDPRPLRKIASGGELSRVMLAVKSALAESDPVPTLVFDEIDTGVGGRLGAALGRKLAELSRHHQVICVTHLPQIASYASHQWIIRKKTERGRTRTMITPLGENERVEEIAAMLRGESAAEGTRQEALSMLIEARGGSDSTAL